MAEERELAQLLRQARESLSLSQEQAANQAGVPLSYIKVLEEEGARHALVPDESYLIPYLRKYAVLLHLDQAHVIPLLLSEGHKPHVHRPPQLVSYAPPRRRLWLGLLVLTGIILALITLRWRAGNLPGGLFGEGTTPTPVRSLEAAGKTARSDTAQSPAGNLAPKAAQTLKIVAEKQSWVTLGIDGGDPETVILQPGEERTWQAVDHFLLSLGNAGVVTVTLNGVEQPPLGKEGEVVRDLRLPPAR